MSERPYKVLIVDPVGLRPDGSGQPDIGELLEHIERADAQLHHGPHAPDMALRPDRLHFFYCPQLHEPRALLQQSAQGQYDALIAAATHIPADCRFDEGGVRIGAGTGNMQSASWGGSSGRGGEAPLMNTPSFNSRVTAQMAFKALLRATPGLPVQALHERVMAGGFDSARDLSSLASDSLEGQRIALLGFGHIGREMARIAQAFAMEVVVYARAAHRTWCESEGWRFASTPAEAAKDAAFLSIHTGLGAPEQARHANHHLVDDTVLRELREGALIINYDRAELIDPAALRGALQQRRVRFVAADADVHGGEHTPVSGPLAPYVQLSHEFPGAFELLPHVAADTDHHSRVQGAKQAIDQIVRAIRRRELVNLVGDLPAGYQNAGARTVGGIGSVRAALLQTLATQPGVSAELQELSGALARFWQALAGDPSAHADVIARDARDMMINANRLRTRLRELGLQGPYER